MPVPLLAAAAKMFVMDAAVGAATDAILPSDDKAAENESSYNEYIYYIYAIIFVVVIILIIMLMGTRDRQSDMYNQYY